MDRIKETQKWIRDLGWILLGLIMILYAPTVKANDNVIFEQIGKMAGSTSYLHPHVTINLSAITFQYEEYRTFLAQEIDRTGPDQETVVTLKPKTQSEINP